VRVGAGGYLLIECGGTAAMQRRSSQLDSNDLDVASRDWLFDVSAGYIPG